MFRATFPNPERPVYWPGEEDHFRDLRLVPGMKVRYKFGALGRIVAFDNTHSSLRGGRLVHLEPIGPSYGGKTAWESDVAPAADTDTYGRHPHLVGCSCGQSVESTGAWVHVGASWEVPA
jgi:hypothetical protein